MGSSSVSCALTGVTLANRPAVLIPLAPYRYGNRNSPSLIGGASFTSNEGAAGLFGPLTLPILGEVGDYGDLESFEEDDHTALLRERLKDDDLASFFRAVTLGEHHPRIDKLARIVGRGAHPLYRKRSTWDGTLSGCWIAREAWDLFSTHAWDDGRGESRYSVYDDGWLSPQNLIGLGFVRGTKDQAASEKIFGKGPHEGERYHTPYTHPKIPRLVFWNDEHMHALTTVDGVKVHTPYTFGDIVKALGKSGIVFPPESIRWAKATTVYHAELLRTRKLYRQTVKMEKEYKLRLLADPHKSFRCISDNASETEIANRKIRFNNSLGANGLIKGWTGPTEVADPEVLPEGSIQTFCDEKYHITVRSPTSDGVSTSHEIGKCTCEGYPACTYGNRIQFSADVWNDLAERNWKIRPRRPSMGFDGPEMRSFPPEAMMLYRGKLLSDAMMPRVEALLTFTGNMGAANRLLSPSPSGWQCGNPMTQLKVAQLAASLCKARMSRYKKANRDG